MTLSTCSLGGDDVTDGGAGLDVLDGGFGWNFLTGGTGADAFFLDGRAGVMTWSTITDFSSEDNVNIWGWQEPDQDHQRPRLPSPDNNLRGY
jgi:serralysin